ncbi:unnamed protein product [Alternaria sp. RS040]
MEQRNALDRLAAKQIERRIRKKEQDSYSSDSSMSSVSSASSISSTENFVSKPRAELNSRERRKADKAERKRQKKEEKRRRRERKRSRKQDRRDTKAHGKPNKSMEKDQKTVAKMDQRYGIWKALLLTYASFGCGAQKVTLNPHECCRKTEEPVW